MPTVAELLRDARETARLTQRELAERSGFSQPHVSAYENGRRQPTMPTIERLFQATGHRLVLGLEASSPRPMTLAETARRIARERLGGRGGSSARGGPWLWVREFLRGFHDDLTDLAARTALIAFEPPPTGRREWDAVLAAIAEHLAAHHDLPCPGWVHEPDRFAEHAWFLSQLPTQRAWAVETSPASFRRRNLFVLPADLTGA